MTELRKIIIDDKEIEIHGALTLIQACEEAGVEIPRFCYHESLSIAGNCRMCLVEVVGGPSKPTASCAMQVRDLRSGPEGEPPQIKTNSQMVKKAREGVMEFLLINHPLDCPICDQGGECDLQDQAMAYGIDFSRFKEAKRANTDLNLGPLVETHMTRCISCTRCVRFTTEVAGIDKMGQTGRGEDVEITSYLGQTLDSNLQGNIIDLCPVGALTSKPYAFTARPWELTNTESIDVMDGLGANIRIDSKGREVMRILPRYHSGINEEWISDKTRFVWDGLKIQRLDKPFVRQNGRLQPASWSQALSLVASSVTNGPLVGLIGDLVCVEAAYALKNLTQALGGIVECRTDGSKLPADNRSAYVGNGVIEEIDNMKNILLIGTNPRIESPVLNSRIRKAWLAGAKVSLLGEPVDLSYDYEHLGNEKLFLEKMLTSETVCPENGDNMVIVGVGALQGEDGEAVLAKSMNLADKLNGKFLILHNAAARVGAMDIGAVSHKPLDLLIEEANVIYNLGSDEIDIPPGPFVIYQGSHGDRGAHRADVVLPAAAYTEENSMFVNTEGRPQLGLRACFPPGKAKENWAIFRAISSELDKPLPYDNLGQLRQLLVSEYPHLGKVDQVLVNDWKLIKTDKSISGSFKLPITDFYMTNPISRASRVMAELSEGSKSRSFKEVAAE